MLPAAASAAARCEARTRHAPVPLGDVEATFADIARAREELGWQPKYSALDALRDTLERDGR